MKPYDLILKKRNGQSLTEQEISFMVEGFVSGEVADYQMSALAMAIYFRGMNHREIADLTSAMIKSGDVIDLTSIPGIKVDKHSTGGVGDKTTLVLAPLAAAAGIPVAKMSGRGLGHTGGTIDKLESIPGFGVELPIKDFLKQVKEIGLAVASQSGNLVPADKKLYALRDVTATVDSIPLIASSVMSKKLASGADAIILDVKMGKGAFVQDLESAKELANVMVKIGKSLGRKTRALITAMDQPLGLAIGNSLEVAEAIETLQGRGPKDLKELCLKLGGQMLFLAERTASPEEGEKGLEEMLLNGSALEKFRQLIAAQGGNVSVVEHPEILPKADFIQELFAEKDGYINGIDALKVGAAAMTAGAGRAKKGEKIDYGAGIILTKKISDRVHKGETIATLFASTAQQGKAALTILKSAVTISDFAAERQPLVFEVV